MLKIVNLLNEMKNKKVTGEYGIGGVTALIYYFEPIQTQYIDAKVQIFSLEYLMAIMIQTGRGKDKARLEEILKAKLTFNKVKLQSILLEFDLSSKWEKTNRGLMYE